MEPVFAFVTQNRKIEFYSFEGRLLLFVSQLLSDLPLCSVTSGLRSPTVPEPIS